MPKTREEIIEAVDWLTNDFRAGGLLAENTDYERTYQLNDTHKFADELTRGRTIIFPVPRMSEWVNNVVNQTISYATFPVLTSLGGLTPSEADKLEAAVALGMAEMNVGQHLTKEAYAGFLKQTHVISQVVPGAMNDPWPFSIALRDIATCFFERFKGGRPPMIARQYRMLIREAEKAYSNKRGQHDGAGKAATFDGKRMKFTELSGQYATTNPQPGMTGKDKFAKMVEVREFHDDEYSCHLIRGVDDSSGEWQEVYLEKTPFGGTPFMVVPSNPQGATSWAADWRPIGWSLYTHKRQIERMESEQQTRGEQAQQHFIARLPPEQLEAAQKLRDSGYAITFHTGPNAIPIAADEIVQLETMTNEGLETRIVRHSADMERYIASWLYPATEQTISQANVGTAQIGMQVVHQQESGLLSNYVQLLGGSVEQIVHAMSGPYAGDRKLYAKDETTYGRLGAKKVAAGDAINLDAALLKKVKVYGSDANVRVEVVTRSETESELEQREAGVWNNVQRGSQVFDEFIAVRNPNVAGQHEALAKDGVRKSLAAVYDAAIPVIAAKRNLQRWGVDLDRLMMGGMQQPGVGAPPGGGTTVLQGAPNTGGVDVGSMGAAPAGAVQ